MERVREFFFRCNMLVLASDVFMEEDYIRDFDEFIIQKNETALHGSQYK
jgi:hypothetical protein